MSDGVLIDELVDVSGPCGISYSRGVSYSREVTELANAAMVMPRGASVVDLEWRSASKKKSARVTTSEVFVLPPALAHAVRGRSCIFDVLVVLPSLVVVDAVAKTYGVDADRITDVFATPHAIARTNWVNELQHRYFFERVVCRRRESLATAFLEQELVKEIYFRSIDAASATTCAPPLLETNTLGRRAVSYVERNLFDPSLDVESIALHVRASRSTLERAFREEAHRSPNEYIRDRRLDEARALIASARVPVGQVARLVGYQNFSAFSQAFKRRFEVLPSQISQA